ncbi:MAG: sugar ABC transporter permease [Spirochaetales bacterium]|nr:sugar ABC transporter permease [Spirochaetales bacterium]
MKHISGYRDKGLGKAFYLFILPAFVLYLIFFLLPFFLGVQYSFLNWNGKTPDIPIQMSAKKFNLLIEKNLPIEISKNDFNEKFLSKINSGKNEIENIYTLNPNEYYTLNLTLDDDVYEKAKKILEESNCSNLFSNDEKNKLNSFYELKQDTYVLKNEVSLLDRFYIKKILAKNYYHNIKNVGFKNYIRLFHDEKFKEVIGFTLFYTFFNMLLINVIALLLALALDSKIKHKKSLRTMFFLPNVVSLIIVAYIWSFIFREGFGALGWKNWLVYENTAPWAIVLTSVWQGVGYIMIIYLAGLQSIPTDILEVASIDGANNWQRFTNITLPLLAPSMTISFFITLTNSLKCFEIMLALTNGANKTTSFVLNVYFEAFKQERVGYSTAQAIILLLIIMAISIVQLSIMKKKELQY